MPVIFPDYHIHTPYCKHATGDMESYIERAIELGLDEIGFSDHMPVMPEPQFCMGYDELKPYIRRVREFRERYAGRITIRLGCEMDIVFKRVDEIRRIIEENEFDYVIGSIHYLDDWPFDQAHYRDVFEKGDIEAIYDRFFDTIIRAAQTGLYDITGHIDNIKRMGYRPGRGLTGTYERVAEALHEMDCTVELNTSGLDTAAEEPYPSPEFLAVLRCHDIPVTLGSDAHKPDHVGRHFENMADYLAVAGYTHIAYFRGRERILKPLREKPDDEGSAR